MGFNYLLSGLFGVFSDTDQADSKNPSDVSILATTDLTRNLIQWSSLQTLSFRYIKKIVKSFD
jgi:hypothetical protein